MDADVRGDHPNETAALQAVADKLGIGSRETLRNWVKQHEVDAGQRPGTTTEESAQLKALKKVSRVREKRMHGLTGGGWKRSPHRPPHQP